MRFDQFLQALDMGHCEDQQQRQALYDLVLFLIMADGLISEEETAFMQNWLDSIEWNSDISKEDYYQLTLQKCQEAIDKGTIDDFLAHRAKLLVDADMQQQAMKLVRDVALADGQLDDTEQYAINRLSELLEKTEG